MSRQVLPDDPGVSDSGPRPHVKRRMTLQDKVNTIGGVIAILGSCSIGASWALDKVPYVKVSLYTHDWAANDMRMLVLENNDRARDTALQTINHNNTLILQLQYQNRVDFLKQQLLSAQRGSLAWAGMQNEINATQQQLDELRRMLNR